MKAITGKTIKTVPSYRFDLWSLQTQPPTKREGCAAQRVVLFCFNISVLWDSACYIGGGVRGQVEVIISTPMWDPGIKPRSSRLSARLLPTEQPSPPQQFLYET